MTEDEKEILMRFHREVFLPDFERIFDSLSGSLELLRKDMRAGFAEFHRRFDRLESQYLPLREADLSEKRLLGQDVGHVVIGDDFDAPCDPQTLR